MACQSRRPDRAPGGSMIVAGRAGAPCTARPPHAPLVEVPLAMALTFHLPRPRSLPKRITEHTKRPDLDNLVKAIKDALRGIVYHDDAQIVRLTAGEDTQRAA